MSKMPKDLEPVVSEAEFSTILTYATSHLKGKIFRDIHLDDGILKYKGNDNEQIEVNFINLVKNVLSMEKPLLRRCIFALSNQQICCTRSPGRIFLR